LILAHDVKHSGEERRSNAPFQSGLPVALWSRSSPANKRALPPLIKMWLAEKVS
jgi:hypothetical protein